MALFFIAVFFTVMISFLCSLTEALILSSTTAEIEALKRSNPVRGALLADFRHNLDRTISTVLTLNTIANTLGATLVGAIGTSLFGNAALGVISGGLTLAILVLAEVIPKNLGVVYRVPLQPHVVFPLLWTQRALLPIIWFCQHVVRFVIPKQINTHAADREIILLAEKGAKEGTLTSSESSIIANALSLDDVRVGAIMTPRIVVTALASNATITDVFREHASIPFARLPVYGRNIDDIIGLVRRRDLLKAKANDQDEILVESLVQEAQFVPETITVAQVLQQFLRTHQQLAVVVDEFGATSGVVTMEDIMEHLLGLEIFEKDDIAVDMRELARSRSQKPPRMPRSGSSSST